MHIFINEPPAEYNQFSKVYAS